MSPLTPPSARFTTQNEIWGDSVRLQTPAGVPQLHTTDSPLGSRGRCRVTDGAARFTCSPVSAVGSVTQVWGFGRAFDVLSIGTQSRARTRTPARGCPLEAREGSGTKASDGLRWIFSRPPSARRVSSAGITANAKRGTSGGEPSGASPTPSACVLKCSGVQPSQQRLRASTGEKIAGSAETHQGSAD
ncbi:hypothetical protein AGIG_G22785 [Arapaima gigas]